MLEFFTVVFTGLAVLYYPRRYWVNELRTNAMFMSKLHAIIAAILFLLSVMFK